MIPLRFLSGVCLRLAFTAGLGAAPPAASPNFLIFMADDLSYHDLGAVGNPDVKTPHLDHFATQGTTFTHTYNASPMCAPTRMSLYTGIHPVRNGGYPNHSAVSPSIRSLPHHLTALGYQVALLGKRHEAPLAQFPFRFLGGRHHDNGQGLDLDTAAAAAFIDEVKAHPWCLVVSSNQPHTPWNRGDASAYDPAELTLPPYLVDTPATREGMAAYYAEITYLDAQFGRVMADLAASGEAAETVVIFLTEQGSNFPFCKWTCYETGLRATTIARWPDHIAANTTNSALIQYIDITPTLVDLAGGDPTHYDFDGTSLASLLTTPGATSPHDYIFGLQTTRGIAHGSDAYAIRTVRDNRYRLIWNLNFSTLFQNSVTKNFAPYLSWIRPAPPSDDFATQRHLAYQQRPEFELYDLNADPWSLHNLAPQPAYQDRIKTLQAALQSWMRQQGDEGIPTELAAFDHMPEK
jgi:N-sulfoglucosamine sulfohydrolase